MIKFILISGLFISTNLFSQINSDSLINIQILGETCLFHGDTVYNKKGQIKTIRPPFIYDIVIENTTSMTPFPDQLSSFQKFKGILLSKLDSSTFNDFVSKNKEKDSVVKVSLKDRRLIYLDSSSIHRIFKKGDWDSFYKIYPKACGLIGFSRIGYNGKKNQALIYYDHSIDNLSGNGYYVLFELKNGKWIKIQEMPAWRS